MNNKATVTKLIKSKKHGYGVQHYEKEDGDIVFFAVYHDPYDLDKNGKSKKKRFKVGLKSEGITEQYVRNIRDQIIVKIRQREFPDIIKKPESKEIFTFESLAESYFQKRENEDESGNKAISINKDKSVLKNHLTCFFKINPRLISDEDVVKLKKDKLQQGRAPKTINNILTLLTSILRYGVDTKKLTAIPQIKKITGIDNAREKYFTQKDIDLIMNNIRENPILSMFVKLSLSTGGRIETVRSIKVKDINLEAGTVLLVDFKGKAAGKNNATYLGFMKQPLVNELERFTEGLAPNSYIFRYDNGTRVGVDYFQNNLQKLFDTLFNKGLEKDRKNKAVIHTLRHTFATHLAKVGTSIYTIQKLLNHSDITMTMRYAKFSPENGQNAINQLNLF